MDINPFSLVFKAAQMVRPSSLMDDGWQRQQETKDGNQLSPNLP